MESNKVHSIHHQRQHSSAGLQTAWLLATLGSKISTKKGIKSDILQLSIPQLCDELIQSNSNFQIRYCSNILYGISLAYRSKVNYFLQDISFIKAQLSKDYVLFKLTNSSSSSSLIDGNLHSTSNKKPSTQVLLNNDPSFDINFDLVPVIDFLIEQDINASVKRRKLDIKQVDQDVFPDSVSLNHTQYHESAVSNTNGLFTSFNQTSVTHDEMLDDFLDRSLVISQQGSDSSNFQVSELDLEFDEDGQLIDKSQPPDPERENYNDFIDDFQIDQQPILEEVNQIDEQQTKSISNDEDFAIANSGELQQQLQALPELDLTKVRKVNQTNGRKHKLVADPIDLLRLSSTTMIDAVNNYEINMHHNTVKDESHQQMLSEIWSSLNSGNISPYLKFVNRISLSKKLLREFNVSQNDQNINLTTSFSINSMMKEIANFKRVENLIVPELEDEVGRDVLPRNLRDQAAVNVSEEDIYGDGVVNDDYNDRDREEGQPRSEDVYNISFGSDDSYARSSSRLGTNENVPEDEIGFGLNGSPLIRFYDLLKQRCEKLGTAYLTENEFKFTRIISELESNDSETNGIDLQQNQESPTQQLSRLKFCEFIPNLESSKDLNEPSVTRKLAANSFSIILTLATKNVIGIITTNPYPVESDSDLSADFFELNSGNNIELVVNCN